MKRLCISVLVLSIILIIIPSFAQTPRNTHSSEGKTAFTNIAVTGLNVDGVPGYIEFKTSAGETAYLYIDDNFNVKIASEQQVTSATSASPQTTDWNNAGSYVGEQTGL